MSRGWGLALRIIAAVALLVLVVWTGLVEQSFIADDPLARVVLVVATALAVLLDTLIGAVAAFRKQGRLERQRDVRKPLIPILREVGRRHGVDVTMIGASVFVVKRVWWSLWLMRRLARVERFRLSDLPQESRVSWRRAKGAIGEAWATNLIVHVDWRPVRDRWGNGKVRTEEDWANVPESDRAGLSFSEFTNIVDKYAEILAIPLLREGSKCIGVLAIDIPFRAEVSRVVLGEDAIVEKAAEAAAVIQNVL